MVGTCTTIGLLFVIAVVVNSMPAHDRRYPLMPMTIGKRTMMIGVDDQIGAGMLWSPRCELLISSFLEHLHQVVNTTVSEREQGSGLAMLMRAAEADAHLMKCFRTGQASAYIEAIAN